MRTRASAAFCLIISFAAHAEVPHVFTAGDPAVASEVNANFSDLDTRVDAAATDAADNAARLDSAETRLDDAEGRMTILETDNADLQTRTTALEGTTSTLDGRASALEAETTTLGDRLVEPSAGHEFVHTPQTAAVGDLIASIDGWDYVLGTMAFQDYGAGQMYKITLPMVRSECTDQFGNPGPCANGDSYRYAADALHFVHAQANAALADFTVSGFPADFVYGDQMVFLPEYHGGEASQVRLQMSSTAAGIQTTSMHPLPYLRVQVGETLVYTRVFGEVSSLGSTKAIPGGVGPDYASILTAADVNQEVDTALLGQYMDLYNYITITPL